MMRSLDLFSGYAGITLALQDYVKPIAYVEIEDYAQKIIAYRMADRSIPRAAILGDVKNVRGELGICDIIYGGFPCQDISIAGNGKGLAGERSGLFYEIIRLTKEIRPTFVFLENVPAIRTRGLREVVRAFTEIGYDCRWTCISAASVGANHKRERWFLLAYSGDSRLRLDVQQVGELGGKEQTDTWGNGEVQSVADANGKRLERCEHEQFGERIDKQRSYSSKKIFSADHWSTEPGICRVVDGTSFRVERIKALGNGVVPLQVKTAFELLMGLK
jgi:DNA (cytosine-5)-methyltransferase 1